MSLSIEMQSNQSLSFKQCYTVWLIGIHRISRIESPNRTWLVFHCLSKTSNQGFDTQAFFQKNWGTGLNIWRSGCGFYFDGCSFDSGWFLGDFSADKIWQIILSRGSESLIPFRKLTCHLKKGTISKGKASLPTCILQKDMLVLRGSLGSVGWRFVSTPLEVDIDMLQASSVRWMRPSMPPPWTGGYGIHGCLEPQTTIKKWMFGETTISM